MEVVTSDIFRWTGHVEMTEEEKAYWAEQALIAVEVLRRRLQEQEEREKQEKE